MSPRYPPCYCKRNGQDTHTCPRFRGRPVRAAPTPVHHRLEHDDAAEKMERRHDRLEGGGWEEA